ncbi:MAG: AsnC family transcriptional regulator [Chloroflexi bacterium]|nr:AsnC family transcriptional regulator [Chloroflexota bacterium]
MATAYVLIKTRVGETASVKEKLASHAHIRSADVIIWPYDIIAHVEADDLNAIGTVVMRFVHELAGVENTITCPVIDA